MHAGLQYVKRSNNLDKSVNLGKFPTQFCFNPPVLLRFQQDLHQYVCQDLARSDQEDLTKHSKTSNPGWQSTF